MQRSRVSQDLGSTLHHMVIIDSQYCRNEPSLLHSGRILERVHSFHCRHDPQTLQQISFDRRGIPANYKWRLNIYQSVYIMLDFGLNARGVCLNSIAMSLIILCRGESRLEITEIRTRSSGASRPGNDATESGAGMWSITGTERHPIAVS